MKGNEENVRTAPGAGQAAEAEEKKGSAVPGKFRSVDALAEAYSALEAEFTRRSQRLRELEKRAENPAAEAQPLRSEAEKPEDGAEERKGGVGSESPSAPRADAAPENRNGRGPALPSENFPRREGAEGTPKGGPDAGTGTEGAPNGGLSDEALYRAASGSERVRLKIIGDYLSSLKAPEAPLVRGGSGTLAAPPRKARSIDEAGNMALLYFKKGGQAQ